MSRPLFILTGVLVLSLLTASDGAAQDAMSAVFNTESPKPNTNPLFEFSAARGDFVDAVDEFRRAFWVEKDRKKAAKRIEQNVNVFLAYLRTASQVRPIVEAEELARFGKLSKTQLASEMLNLAQSLRPQLDRTLRAGYSALIHLEHWDFLYKLEVDLLRLKWMNSRLR